MPIAPNTNNYVLGKGIAYFDIIDSENKYAGERDLGNAVSFELSVVVDKLDHFTNRSGLKSKDKTVVSSLIPSVSFVIDEINVENVALMFMGEVSEISQSADDDITFLFDVSAISGAAITGNRFYDVGEYKNIGVYTLAWDGGAGGIPLRGETITGAGGATAVIINVVDGSTTASGSAYVNTLGGTLPFVENETITTATLTSGAVNHPVGTPMLDTTSGCVFDITEVAISDTATHATVYVKGDDYTVDSATGRVKVVDGGSLDAIAADTDVEFAVMAQTYSKIMAFNVTSVEGRLRFVPDNPVGTNMGVMVWRVDLSPAGPVALIGDAWQELEFTGEILKDESGHPLEPYYRIETTDTV